MVLQQRMRDRDEKKIRRIFALPRAKRRIYIELESRGQTPIFKLCEGILEGVEPQKVDHADYARMIELAQDSPELQRPAIAKGDWVRVRRGMYKGDVALVLAADAESDATKIALVPRLDLSLTSRRKSASMVNALSGHSSTQRLSLALLAWSCTATPKRASSMRRNRSAADCSTCRCPAHIC